MNKRDNFLAAGSTELPYIIGNILHNVTTLYLTKFPKGHFKHVHPATKLASREFTRRNIRKILIKNKPILSIVPRAELKDNVMLYSNSFTTISPMDISIISDKDLDMFTVPLIKNMDSNVRLFMTMTNIVTTLEFTEIYETREQQLSAWWSSKPYFELEPCQRVMYIKFPIQERFIYKLAEASNYLKDGEITDPILFCRELNKHTTYPIYYEKDTATGKYRYFITIETSYMFRFSQPDKDDGEKKGDAENNFRVTRNIEVELPVPSVVYFAYKDEKWKPELYADTLSSDTIVPIQNIRYDWIERYKDGMYIQGYSKYAFDTEGDTASFTILDVMFDKMYIAYKKAIETGIDLSKLINVKLYINREESDKFTFDYVTGNVTIPNGSIDDTYVIVVYGDLYLMKKIIYTIDYDSNYIEDGNRVE